MTVAPSRKEVRMTDDLSMAADGENEAFARSHLHECEIVARQALAKVEARDD